MGGEVRKFQGVGKAGTADEHRVIEREMRVCDRLAEMLGQTVIVSGTFPMPVPTPPGEKQQVVCAPTSKGKLVAVYVDGFDLDDGDPYPETYLFANVRCVQPISALMVPKQEIAKPGSN